MSITKALARALGRNPYGAEARVLADGTMVGPKVTGWHGSRDPWLLAGKMPALTSQTGLHVGTKEQASRFSDGPTWPGRGYRGKVTLAEGREIETPDLVSWDGDMWEKALSSGRVKGLAQWESDGLVDYIKAEREADGPVVAETVRKVLADDLGVKRVKYNNTHEGFAGSADNWSYIATAPDVITTHSIGKQLKDAAPYIGAGGALAAGAAALAPGEAEAARLPKGITAYHGSPHKFDRFDISKVGSGEGAQTYGHGLYFGENEAVARAYRNKLGGDTGHLYQVNINASPDDLIDLDKPVSQQSPAVRDFLTRAVRTKPRPMGDDYYDLGEGFSIAPEQPLFGPVRYRLYRDGKKQKEAFASVEEAAAGFVESPDTLAAADALSRFGKTREAQTRAALEAGIPGARYLDQGSRQNGQGTRNYVVFDDKLVDILKRYALPGAVGVGAGALAMQPGEAQAATPNSALARAIARQAPRFNEALDTSLDGAGIVDPSFGYATETARALKDLPRQIQGSALNKGAGTLALAPLTGATQALSSIGQLPEMAVDGYRAVSRALARAKADADARAREQDVYGKPGILYRRGK